MSPIASITSHLTPRRLSWPLAAVGLIVLSTAVLLLTSAAGAVGYQPRVRDITLDARQFAYSPATITVHQGDRVRIHLVSTDVMHGFYLDSYGVEVAAPPGRPSTVEFVASRAGTFRYRCSQTCGPLHPFMIGEMTVLPASPTNPGPFVATVALAVVLGIGTLGWVWKSSSRSEVTNG